MAVDEQVRLAASRVRLHRGGARASERHWPKWAQALEMIDELAGWGQVPPVTSAGAWYEQSAPFRTGLSQGGISYVLAAVARQSARG